MYVLLKIYQPIFVFVGCDEESTQLLLRYLGEHLPYFGRVHFAVLILVEVNEVSSVLIYPILSEDESNQAS